MKFIRAELHNHSTESDGALSVETLAAYAAEKNFGVLALTDHNTTSGHAKAYDATVSYTHLDVYKRQLSSCAGKSPARRGCSVRTSIAWASGLTECA